MSDLKIQKANISIILENLDSIILTIMSVSSVRIRILEDIDSVGIQRVKNKQTMKKLKRKMTLLMKKKMKKKKL